MHKWDLLAGEHVKWSITAEDEQTAKLGAMHLAVGAALSVWGDTESLVTGFYVHLVCPPNVPIEGALATMGEIRDFSARVNIINKALGQVLFTDSFADFRNDMKKGFKTLTNLAEQRNKIAHGSIFEYHGDNVFIPYFSGLAMLREQRLRKTRKFTSQVKTFEIWSAADLLKRCQQLRESQPVITSMVDKLWELYQTRADEIVALSHMSIPNGLPVDTSAEGWKAVDPVEHGQSPTASKKVAK